MKPNPEFLSLPRSFWAFVRTISQNVGYTLRGQNEVSVPSLPTMVTAFKEVDLDPKHLVKKDGTPTDIGKKLNDYFRYRADQLNKFVEPRLMDAERAKSEFEKLKRSIGSVNCPIPMNKQTGTKKAEAFLTGMVNMLIASSSGGFSCDFDPRQLTTVTRDGAPLRTLARRIDGAFPSAINPIAVWEIKEYYYTTTFGSRVADGVYETLLDGMELDELHEHEKVKVLHYLIIDAHYTWWDCGRSYLCRIFDTLHMGYIDEVLFGYEVIERMPSLVKEWVAIARNRGSVR